MKTRQWRLSFSRAEIALINSWTPVQQINCLSPAESFFAKNDELLTEKVLTTRKNAHGQKGKVFPHSLPSIGPGADPGVQAVSPQVT